jgi:hypothetical protein
MYIPIKKLICAQNFWNNLLEVPRSLDIKTTTVGNLNFYFKATPYYRPVEKNGS